MKGSLPKSNHSLGIRTTSSGPTSFSNSDLSTAGNFDASAQIGADPTDSSDPTAGGIGSADQIGSGFGYDITGMLPLRLAFVSAAPTPAPAPPTVNPNQSTEQAIAPPSPTGGQQAPAHSVFYFFSDDGADATVSFGGVNPGILIGTGAGATTGSGSIAKVGTGTLTLNGGNTSSGGTSVTGGTLDVISNVGTTAGNEGTLNISAGWGDMTNWSGAQATTGTPAVATPDFSTTTVVTLPIWLLNQFMAAEFVTPGPGYGGSAVITAATHATESSNVLFAAAPPKA